MPHLAKSILIGLAFVSGLAACGSQTQQQESTQTDSYATTSTQNRVELADPALAATKEARHRLKYLAACALPADTMLVAEAEGKQWEFPGAMGLTPAWIERALTETEERWLSACILAHTNHFGAHVLISIRYTEPGEDEPKLEPGEAERFAIHEGAFFGNIFSDNASAYVCTPTQQTATAEQLKQKKRVCTLPTGQKTGDGKNVTTCGFISVGPCNPNEPQTVDGESWNEVIHVWLEPPVDEE